MAALAEQALRASVQAFLTRNRQLAYTIILRDDAIDELETELDRLCLTFLTRQLPAAGHLRFVFATIHINRELERIGDYAGSIARQVLGLEAVEARPAPERFMELGEVAGGMVRDAVWSFLQGDAGLARRTMVLEERANLLRDQINADLRAMSEAGQLPAHALASFMTVARRLERATDQAKNLCEDVLYMCTGEFIRHRGGEGCLMVFVDQHNSCLSQMAEAMARRLRLPRFTFASAGITPRPLDSRMAGFMAARGFDLAGQQPKGLGEVPGWERAQVVITLGGLPQAAIPGLQPKAMLFAWPLADPAASAAAPPPDPYETAFLGLESHLRELLGAILQEPVRENTL